MNETTNGVLQDVVDTSEKINECAEMMFDTMRKMVSPSVGVGILIDMASQLVIHNGVARDQFVKAVSDAYDLSMQAINGVIDEAK